MHKSPFVEYLAEYILFGLVSAWPGERYWPGLRDDRIGARVAGLVVVGARVRVVDEFVPPPPPLYVDVYVCDG
jgi:hypothetical protein